jgi:hypothetical protein
MITAPEEYFANLFLINHTGSVPSIAVLLPSDERIYDIDLNSKVIDAPEFLSVRHDHYAETIYFKVDRYFDNMDLADTACVVQYVNASGEGRLFTVPFYDIEHFHDDSKMLIPWCIEGEATKTAGDVTYAFRFFKVAKNEDGEEYLTFNLNTVTATSKVLHGLNVLDYYPVNLTKETYEPNKYYIKNGDSYILSSGSFSSRVKYYSVTDKYNYPPDDLDALKSRVAELEKGNMTYWYDAGVDPII